MSFVLELQGLEPHPAAQRADSTISILCVSALSWVLCA